MQIKFEVLADGNNRDKLFVIRFAEKLDNRTIENFVENLLQDSKLDKDIGYNIDTHKLIIIKDDYDAWLVRVDYHEFYSIKDFRDISRSGFDKIMEIAQDFEPIKYKTNI